MHSAQSISPEKTNRQRQPCMQAHESVEDSDQCQVNTSPEFKGIKTSFAKQGFDIWGSKYQP
jgi:hypothetical protein